jgi:hypothetical protein
MPIPARAPDLSLDSCLITSFPGASVGEGRAEDDWDDDVDLGTDHFS